jgi:hypothetical protein
MTDRTSSQILSSYIRCKCGKTSPITKDWWKTQRWMLQHECNIVEMEGEDGTVRIARTER